MTVHQNDHSRRSFIKKMGLTALAPLATPVAGTAAISGPGAFHRVFSCNIRVALPEDDAKGVGWEQRKNACIQVIRHYRPDIICLQEVLAIQMEDLRRAFPGFTGFGFDGPEMDAHSTGYHGIAKNPILFSKERYELLSGGSYWLSETPLQAASISWNTARARHCNWLRLQDKKTGREFRIINTHLDHISQEARAKQIAVILAEASQYHADFPQIFAGDFNSRTGSNVMQLILAAGWQDSYAFIHGNEDPGFTAHDFKGAAYAEVLKAKNAKGGRIDFIFSTGNISPKASSIIKDQVRGIYPSDHYFIYADFEMKT